MGIGEMAAFSGVVPANGQAHTQVRGVGRPSPQSPFPARHARIWSPCSFPWCAEFRATIFHAVFEALERPRNAVYSRSAALRSFLHSLRATRRRYPAASLELDQATADRIADEASGAVDVGFPHDPGPVGLGGLEADPLELGDLFPGLALLDQLEDLALPLRH